MTDKGTSGQCVQKSPELPEGLFLMDGIEGLRSLPRHSVDMLLTDPPYGTTRNFWDVPLPLPELWDAVKWAVKPDGAVLFFAQCPYDKVLGASNLSMLRYEWVWYKSRCTGFLNARRAPLKKTENILVFYQKLPLYNPQFEQGKPYKKIAGNNGNSTNYGKFTRSGSGSEDGLRFPGNVLTFPAVQRTVHPTQKPVALCEYFIKTYTRPGEVVVDICAGSATTAVAALNTGRRFICFETVPAYYAAATEKAGAKIAGFVKRHPVGVLLALTCVLLLFMMQSCSSSLVMLGNSGAGAVGATTYPSEDGEILAAEAAYSGMEAELQNYLDTYTATHSYDEYHFDLDEIEHDPYVLISILCALHEGEWTADEVQGTLETLFDRQYILTERVVRETRYDSDGDPYSWYICYVTLENKNLSHLPVEMMGEEQMARYSLYMSTLGNRPDLFPESAYVGKYITNPPADYDVPEEYLDDETFAAILGEAERYLGYPYVWGGSSPATSFDCSGFVSWVINHSGWNVGRLGAQGLYNICTPTSNPKPGDLVFFVGTYDTAGVSHCGIYVGDGMMIHCGDPIQYANLNTSYWQSHFYAYGRLP